MTVIAVHWPDYTELSDKFCFWEMNFDIQNI